MQYLLWNNSQSKYLGKIVRGQKVYIKFPPEYSPSLQQSVSQRCIFAANSSYVPLFNEFPNPFWPHVNPSHSPIPPLKPTAEPRFGEDLLCQLLSYPTCQGPPLCTGWGSLTLPWIFLCPESHHHSVYRRQQVQRKAMSNYKTSCKLQMWKHWKRRDLLFKAQL